MRGDPVKPSPGVLSSGPADIVGQVVIRMRMFSHITGLCPPDARSSPLPRVAVTGPPDITQAGPMETLNSNLKKTGCSIKRKETPTQDTPWMTLKNFIPGRTPDPQTTHCPIDMKYPARQLYRERKCTRGRVSVREAGAMARLCIWLR